MTTSSRNESMYSRTDRESSGNSSSAMSDIENNSNNYVNKSSVSRNMGPSATVRGDRVRGKAGLSKQISSSKVIIFLF